MGICYFEQTGNGYTLAGYVPSDSEIDAETEKSIADRYPYSEEQKMRRLAMNAIANGQPVPEEYTEYNNYVNQRVSAGKARKQQSADILAGFTRIKRTDASGQEQEIYVV